MISEAGQSIHLNVFAAVVHGNCAWQWGWSTLDKQCAVKSGFMQGVPCINQQAVKNLWMEKNVLACRNTKETCGKHNVTLVGSQLCSLLLKVVWSCMWLPSVFEGPRKSKLYPRASISLIFPILSCTTRSSSLESSFSLCLFDLGGVVCNQYACQIDEFLDGVPKIYMLSISCISFISSPSSPRIVMTSRLTKRDDMFLGNCLCAVR